MGKSKMQHAMYYAVILGVYFIVQFLLSILLPNNIGKSAIDLILTLIIPFLVFRFQKKYRDEELDGTISYYNAFSYGVLLFFYASLILGIVLFLYYQFINPDFLTKSFEASLQLMEQMKFSNEMIDKFIEIGVPTPASAVFQNIFGSSLLGVFVSLITSIFVKKENLFS